MLQLVNGTLLGGTRVRLVVQDEFQRKTES